MGCNFCRKKGYERVNYLAPEEKEIVLKDYSSPNDEPLDILESKQNFLNRVQLVDYINLLEQFSKDTSEIITDEPMHSDFSPKDEFLDESMSLEEFQSFIENKILMVDDLKDLIQKESKIIFKKLCDEIYKGLENKLREHDNSFNTIEKRNILAIGILYCDCENIEKIKLFFDIYKYEEKNEFVKSEKLNDFLITLFLISSYCITTSRNNIFDEQKGIKKLEKEQLLNLYKISELKNCENLVNIFNESFFKNESYNWNDFKKKFMDVDKGFGWIFSSKGIRRKLEENTN